MADARSSSSDDSQGGSPSENPTRPGLIKGPWSPAEDLLLADLVKQLGAREWSSVSLAMAQHGHHRLGKQCRERYA